MDLSAVQDFYLMEALWHQKSELPIKKSADKWLEDASTWRDKLNHDLSLAMHDYLFMAACGEARHAPGKKANKQVIPELQKFYSESRQGVYDLVRNYDPQSNCQQLVDLFYTDGWDSAMGGDKWGNIVHAVISRKKWGDVVFIDHAIDLQHNSGTAFSKPTDSYIDFRLGTGEFWGFFKRFLDYKAVENILNNKVSDAWIWKKYGLKAPYLNLAYKTKMLFHRFLSIQRKPRPAYFERLQITNRQEITYKPVPWGDAIFAKTEEVKSTADLMNGSNPYNMDCCISCREGYNLWEEENGQEKEEDSMVQATVAKSPAVMSPPR